MSKKRKINQTDLIDFANGVDNEGIGYYMIHWGPDLDVIENLGFDREEVENAIQLFREIESKAEELLEESEGN